MDRHLRLRPITPAISTVHRREHRIDFGKERSYLATKPEILDHLRHCLNVISKRVEVDERFGWNYVSHKETGSLIRVTLQAPDGQTPGDHRQASDQGLRIFKLSRTRR